MSDNKIVIVNVDDDMNETLKKGHKAQKYHATPPIQRKKADEKQKKEDEEQAAVDASKTREP